MKHIDSTTRTGRLPSSLLSLGLGLLVSIGCAGSGDPGLQLPADPQATSQAELASLWDQIGVKLTTAKPGSDAALKLQGQRTIIGDELANRAAATVRSRMSVVERVSEQIPLDAIARELDGLGEIQNWSAAVYGEIQRELEAERRATNRALAEGEASLDGMSIRNVVGRLELLDELAAIAGSGSPEQPRYVLQREKILRNVSEEAEDAILNEDYEKAQNLLGIVQEVDPTDSAARQAKCQVDGKVIVKRFNTALETGRAGRTMDMLREFSETDCFNDIKDGLAAEAIPIAEAFGMLGQESTATDDLTSAYRRYQDANVLSTLLLGRKAQPPGMSSFLKKLDRRYEKAFEAGEFGAAWGYLNVMTEFGPTTPQIRQKLRKTRDEIARRAVRGLTAYPFEDAAASAAKVGDAVSSKVVQHIFRTIPSDVRIVERDQLERILAECKRGGTCGELDTADFQEFHN